MHQFVNSVSPPANNLTRYTNVFHEDTCLLMSRVRSWLAVQERVVNGLALAMFHVTDSQC